MMFPFRPESVLAAFLVSVTSLVHAQGSLTPPGVPGPTMKTLDQIEPRIPISALPTSISRPGSYYVVSNLTGTSGITILANDVTIDLSGCTLRGGTGSGIDISGVRTNILIRNGAVVGWGQSGITASAGTLAMSISEVRALGNTSDGIRAGFHSTIDNCIALHNGGNGIAADRGSRIEGCVARTNFFEGVVLSNGRGVIARCTAEGNANGLFASTASVIRDSTAIGNLRAGIRAGGICLIEDCIASQNVSNGIVVLGSGTVRDCVVYNNGVDGIIAADSATLSGNTVTLNGTTVAGAGVRLTAGGSRVDGNHFVNNDYAILWLPAAILSLATPFETTRPTFFLPASTPSLPQLRPRASPTTPTPTRISAFDGPFETAAL
jgi:hypothetical protein